MDAIPRQLGAILDMLGLDWTSLFVSNREAGQNRERVLAWLYRILDTLDNKTGYILGFTALLLAAHTFLAGFLVANRQTPHWISITVLCFLVFPLGTGVFAFSIFKVRWPFFGYVRKIGEGSATEDQIEKELKMLAEVCDGRVKANQRSFYLCAASAVAFFVTLVLALIVVIKYGPSA